MKDKKSRIHEFGCLMANVSKEYEDKIFTLAKLIIPKNVLYVDPEDPSYGYSDEIHTTIKYGFTPDLTKKDIAGILKGIKPFNITILGVSLFENEKYDVVKLDVEKNDILKDLRSKADKFPNEDKFPNYHPHVTLGYVQKGKLPIKNTKFKFNLPIDKFKYGGINPPTYYINI